MLSFSLNPLFLADGFLLEKLTSKQWPLYWDQTQLQTLPSQFKHVEMSMKMDDGSYFVSFLHRFTEEFHVSSPWPHSFSGSSLDSASSSTLGCVRAPSPCSLRSRFCVEFVFPRRQFKTNWGRRRRRRDKMWQDTHRIRRDVAAATPTTLLNPGIFACLSRFTAEN